LAATLGAACLVAGSSPAEACWDGYSASVGHVAIAQAGDGEWRRDEALALAEWMTKTDAMLPPHVELSSEHGHIELREEGLAEPIAEGTWSGRDVRDLFKKTGELLGARRVVDARRASTMRVGTPYTVQLLAVKSRASAERFATATNTRDEPLDLKGNFYSAGGYPAIHPVAHVLDADPNGPRDGLTRVVAGAFLDEQSARAAAADLGKQGVAAFARPL
jgi:hypothetical protein